MCDDHSYCDDCWTEHQQTKHDLSCYCCMFEAPDPEEMEFFCLEHPTLLPVERRVIQELAERGITIGTYGVSA